MNTTAVDELRFRLDGGLFEPGDAEYEDARTLFNSTIDKRPRYVARCAAADDVIAGLAFAREHDLEIAVRAGGHSVVGLSLCDGGLVLDVRGMDDVDVDPVRRIARVGGGATWAQVDRATQAHGLATTGGRVSTTGVGGFTLGGGSGWLERKHGLACDNLLAVELVTADGSIVRASADENPELLWALRGGGGNFGVVTSFEFRLHPVGPEVIAGTLVHPLERGRELMRIWRDVMRDAPEELSLSFGYMPAAAEDPQVPAELRGKLAVVIAGMHAGSVREGEEALRPIRELGAPFDGFRPVPYAEFQCSIDDPPGYRNYWTAEQLPDLPDGVVDLIHSRALEMPGSAPQIWCSAWGAAVARVGIDSSPLAGRDARFIVHPFLMWDDPADDQRVISWGRSFRDALRAHSTGATYLNFTGEEGEPRLRSQYLPGAHERLAQIKASWDPEDVFRASGHLPPTPTRVGKRDGNHDDQKGGRNVP